MNIGILGAGGIAEKMSRTLSGMADAKKYAIASRALSKAEAFAKKWGFEKAYGSYEEMLKDPKVDLVYIATPHSEHFAHMKLCILAKKPALCEKAFTRNADEAREITALAKSEGVLVTEAIWTRYMPSRQIINELLASGIIGEVKTLTANLHYPISHVKRIVEPSLAGGALLDVGVYAINFALMHFGDKISRIESNCSMLETGVDAVDSITFIYEDGKVALLNAGIYGRSDRHGIFFGDKGYLVVDNINDPLVISVYDTEDNLLQEVNVPKQITGYEYEVEEALMTIRKGGLECESMPHAHTIQVMEIMDDLRRSWGVLYPGENI